MQRNKQKLREANKRRLVGKFTLFIAVMTLIPYVFFLVSDGHRDFLNLGHHSLAIFVSLITVAAIIMKPIYRLEYPFLYSKNR